MTSLKQTAIAYAREYGWHVFPLAPGSKKPFEGSKGVLGATNDPVLIKAWWDEYPDANIGIATGPSGLAVLDADMHAKDWTAASIRFWQELPETLTSRTPSGGEHRIYTGDVRSTARHLAPGVDTRGQGGYIVAPPSIVGGRTYDWKDARPPAPIPKLVLEGLEGPKYKEAEHQQHGTRYGIAVLNGEAGKLALRTDEGERNNTLFASSVRIFELVKAGELDRDYAISTIIKATSSWANHSEPFTEREVQSVMESAWKRAEARPPGDSQEGGESLPTEPRYLSIEELAALPPPQWLVPGVLPEGMSLLYGKHASGKTFVALDFALTIASFGGVVIYCAGEGVSGMHSRVEAWQLAHPRLDPKGFVVLANDAFPRLTIPQAVDRFHLDVDMVADAYGAPTLVVVDTWRRALAPQSVNGDEVVAQSFMALDHVRSKYGTSTLILHHPRKAGQGESSPPEAGSGSLQDNVDFTWKLWPVDDSDKILYNTKSKDFEEQPSLRFTLKPMANSLVAEPSVSELMF